MEYVLSGLCVLGTKTVTLCAIYVQTGLSYVTRMGEGRRVYRVLVGRPEKKTLGRSRRRWEDNIKIGLRGERDRWGEMDLAGSG